MNFDAALAGCVRPADPDGCVEKMARAMWETHGRPPAWWDDPEVAIDREQYRRYVMAALQSVKAPADDPHTAREDGPHSRACGWRKHSHGPACHSNCPTCGGAR